MEERFAAYAAYKLEEDPSYQQWRTLHWAYASHPSLEARQAALHDVRAVLGACATSAASASSLLAVLERGLYVLDSRTDTAGEGGRLHKLTTAFAVSSPRGELVTFHSAADSFAAGISAYLAWTLDARIVGVADEAVADDAGLREAMAAAERGLDGLELAGWVEDTLVQHDTLKLVRDPSGEPQPAYRSDAHPTLPSGFVQGPRAEAQILLRSVSTLNPFSGGGQQSFLDAREIRQQFTESRGRTATARTLLESLGLGDGAVHPEDLLLALLVISKFLPVNEALEHWTTPPSPTFGFKQNVHLRAGLCLWSECDFRGADKSQLELQGKPMRLTWAEETDE
jgi:hypothetical protein